MIVSFSVENWKSFRTRTMFSMVATQERQHGERVPKINKYRSRILPIATIYGGNASGKTNFFQALNFAKEYVLKGGQPDSLIAVEPFRLDDTAMEEPSRFSFEILIDENLYSFHFSVTRNAVLKEKLALVNTTGEKVLYERCGGKSSFHQSLKNTRCRSIFEGTRDNQLFLTNSVSQKLDLFRPVYDWFRNTLVLIAPDALFASFGQLMDETDPLFSAVNEILPQLDTGIAQLNGETISLEKIPLPDLLKSKLQEDLKEGMAYHIPFQGGERFIVTRKNGDLIAKKLVTYHSGTDGSQVLFGIRQESDGSQRVIDLLPAFLDLSDSTSKKVYVIDEIDRSLHTLLIRQLLEVYLSCCNKDSRSQLLLTTHNVLLMDQDLLRRDEIWVTERDSSGISTLFSFSEYKDVRYDKDIRKSYLQGRLGGIPRLLLGPLSTPCQGEKNRKVI